MIRFVFIVRKTTFLMLANVSTSIILYWNIIIPIPFMHKNLMSISKFKNQLQKWKLLCHLILEKYIMRKQLKILYIFHSRPQEINFSLITIIKI